MAIGGGSGNTTLIARGTELVGDISFSGDLTIEGTIKGNISAAEGSKACVSIVESGLVEGEILAPSVIVNGAVKGNVVSSEHIELASKARVEGNIYYNLIEMVKGSQVNGNLIYRDKESGKLVSVTKIEKAKQA